MNDKLGIYIHIPFCVRKCPYCDFYSIDMEHFFREKSGSMAENPPQFADLSEISGKSSLKEQFLRAICREIREKAPLFSEKSVNTVYFGGGTPSILDSNHIKQIFEEVKKSFFIEKEGFEATIELNPGTISAEKLSGYLDLGISRASIGFQSLDDGVLKTLGRIHNRDQAIDAYKMAREAGFRNISIDLMFAIPGQSMAVWEDTVKRAIDLGPEHISLYSLEFMEGTRFDKMRRAGQMMETDAELDRYMYERALDLMEEAGYVQYEISNCTKPGCESKHNMKYWDLSEYIGFGPSAHSYYAVHSDGKCYNARFENPSNLEEYIKNPLNAECYSKNSINDDIAEYTFTGLRKAEGVNFESFEKKFGVKFWEHFGEATYKEFQEFVRSGFAIELNEGIEREACGAKSPAGIFLTRKGFSISNKIMELFV